MCRKTCDNLLRKILNKVNYRIVAYSIVAYKFATLYAVSRITKCLK